MNGGSPGHPVWPVVAISASTAARICSGNAGQASTTCASSGSLGMLRAPANSANGVSTAPDSAPPVSESGVFPEESEACSSPSSPISGEILNRVAKHLQAGAFVAGGAVAGPVGVLRGEDVPFGVGHQAQDAAGRVAQTGDVG